MHRCLTTQELGQIIQQRRVELGLTQQQLSEYTGYSRRLIGDIENGKPGVAVSKIFTLLNGLGLNICIEAR